MADPHVARDKPSAIMCYEEEFRQYHHQYIEERLEGYEFKLNHLGGDP